MSLQPSAFSHQRSALSVKPKAYFSVTILTKPYLKKYLHTLYGNPIVFTTDNLFGVIIAAMLERPIEFQRTKEALRCRVDHYTQSVEIHCPMAFLTKGRYGFDINERHILTLNKFYEAIFEEKLYQFCAMHSIGRVEIKDSLEEFCRLHGIEIDEDITWEALKKKEYRYRKNLQNISPQLSPQNSPQLQFCF